MLPFLTKLSVEEHARLYHNRKKIALRTKALNLGYREYLAI